MTVNLKIEISQTQGHRHKTLLKIECDTPEHAVAEINRFLARKYPETFERLYPIFKKEKGEVR